MSKLVIKNKRMTTAVVVVFVDGVDKSIQVGPRACVELDGAQPTPLLKRKAAHREITFTVVGNEPRIVTSRPSSRKSKVDAGSPAEVSDPVVLEEKTPESDTLQ